MLSGPDEGRSPRAELVEHITEVWRDVLGVDRIDPDQDFFELGGHSLGAIRTASRLGEELGRDLSLRVIFEHRTVDALAAAIVNDDGVA
ncbi:MULTISPECIES: phosphopantetheine-binding protein [unclassified Streptomyces]|uniref:phosphopantetheine-binding protein n=1 Tax=Streptomycetaceae TaxID=2062 RepID=UPI002E76B008|nr:MULTISPECIES: phosphopantetheine-binding protein [unclassified Streptomyces]MED7952460.1 phosphopantetheine-binding protein [Streptomyces sp. BE303]MEE1822714.1 phosphopantetheine-binding protein [Streptomyces sp. BE20]